MPGLPPLSGIKVWFKCVSTSRPSVINTSNESSVTFPGHFHHKLTGFYLGFLSVCDLYRMLLIALVFCVQKMLRSKGHEEEGSGGVFI